MIAVASRPVPKQLPKIAYTLAADDDVPVDSGDYRAPLLGPEAYVEDVRLQGGLGFLERAEKYGKTDQGKPVKMRPWYRQSLRCTGDHRIPYRVISGAAQTGKSLACQLAVVDVLIHGRMPTGYAYASNSALNKYVSTQFRPIIRHWVNAIETEHQFKLLQKNDKNTNDPMTVGGVAANFSFASSSKETAQNEGKAVVAGSGASYTAAIMGQDEKTRWPSGVSFSARLGYSPIPSKPMFNVGTKGGGAGIELEIEKCDRIFTQHHTCEKCGVTEALSPLGCLFTLSTVTDAYGRKKQDYFDADGRPVDWWYTGDQKTPENAVIACSQCGHPISMENRLNAHMRCTLTGVHLDEYLDGLPQDWRCTDKVALDFSPLCRENSQNLALALVNEGLTCGDTRIFQQEDLGIVSRNRRNRITLDMLKPIIGAPCPDELLAWRTVAGIDCGRGQHWLWINRVYMPMNWAKLRWQQAQQTAIRQVLFGGRVHKDQIEDLLERFNVDYGLIDNEPEITWAAGLCEYTCLEMANQRATQRDDIMPGETRSGGEEYPCWQTSDRVFKQIVVNNCARPAWDGRPSYRFPSEWDRWVKSPTNDSPLRHLMGPSFDATKEKWVRPDNHLDDIFMAAYFAEAAMAIMFDGGPLPGEVEY